MKLVFDKLRKNQLYVKKEKCVFAQKRITYLRYVIRCGQISMDSNKIKVI